MTEERQRQPIMGPSDRNALSKRMARLIFFLARLFALGCGWLAAGATALLSGFLLGVPILPVFLASGFLWTCLLLLD
jgi:hypothetical protein